MLPASVYSWTTFLHRKCGNKFAIYKSAQNGSTEWKISSYQISWW